MTKFFQQVWGSVNLPDGGDINTTVNWPGGRGQIILTGFGASSNSQKITLHQSIDNIGLGFSDFPNVPDLSADGVYPFEAPECEIRFNLNVNSGEDASLVLLAVVKTV